MTTGAGLRRKDRRQPDAATTEAPGSDPAETAPTSEPEAAPDEPAPTSWQLIRVARLRDRTGADDEEYPRPETRAEADELIARLEALPELDDGNE